MIENKVLNRNLKIIKNRYPNLYYRLNDTFENKLDIQVLESKDQNKYMRINNGERTINVNSRYKPLDEASRWVESIDLQKNSKLVIFGFGLGYRIKELSKRISNEESLLIIESNLQIFREAISNIDLSKIIEKNNITLIIGEQIDVVKKRVLEFTNWTNVNNVNLLYIPNYDKLFHDELMFYIKTIKDIIDINIGNYNTIKNFNQLFYSNFIENIPHIIESTNIKELFNKFQNNPAIIVSAGPSLAKNVELLKEIKNKAVIICVGTALRVLLDKGIKPDLVITVDPDIANYRHFENVEFNDIPLIYYSCVNSRILDKHKGHKFIFKFQDIYLEESINDYMRDIEKLSSGGSVAHNALDLAIKMGADPIIFIGQDLAYTNDKTHSKGTIYENESLKSKKEDKKLVTVKDIYGNEIITDNVLYSYLRWFENVIEANNGRIYIDATEGGAKIKGTNILTLQETIEKYCTDDISIKETIQRIIQDNKSNKISIDQVLIGIKRIHRELNEIINLCWKINKLINEFLQKYDVLSDNESLYLINKLKTLENELNSYDQDIKAISFILNPILLDINNKRINKDDITLKEQIEINKLYFQAIDICSHTAICLFKNLIEDNEDNNIKILQFAFNMKS